MDSKVEQKVYILPPRIRDLNSFPGSRTEGPDEVWEISVPSKNSLYWSLFISYLMQNNINEHCLQMLTGDDKRVCQKFKPPDIAKRIQSFNPFLNKNAFFTEKKMKDLMRDFELRLKQFANKMKTRDKEWNDKLKLEAACKMLNCPIKVCNPEEGTVGQYGTETHENGSVHIILFLYENQTHGKRKDKINIFRLAMTTEWANPLKIKALRKILKKAEFSEDKENIISIMENPKNHGNGFLSALLENGQHRHLNLLYRSPYITLKLSQAGFNMNPLETDKQRKSPFAFLLEPEKRKYFNILYEYAAQCKLYFEQSTRNCDEIVLESLTRIEEVLENDKRLVNSEDSVRVLKQYIVFNNYIQEITKEICEIKKIYTTNSTAPNANIQKEIICTILETYLKFFSYQDDCNGNYWDYFDYYFNLDYKAFLYLFDNLHSMKRKLQFESDIYNELETAFFRWFLCIKFLSDYPDLAVNRVNRDMFKGYRNILLQTINEFLENIDSGHPPSGNIDGKITEKSLSSLPQYRDECVISEVINYVDAAISASLDENVTKGAFTIQRALQIIGESMKPSETPNCIVPYLLSAVFPKIVQDIRNVLSHTKNAYLVNKMEILREKALFKGIQGELNQLKDNIKKVKIIHVFNVQGKMIGTENERAEISETDKEDGTFGTNLLFRLENILMVYRNSNHAKNCISTIKTLSRILSSYYDICPARKSEIDILESNCTKIEEHLSELDGKKTVKDIIRKLKLQSPKLEGDDTCNSFQYIETFYRKLTEKRPFIYESEKSELLNGLNSVYEECSEAKKFFERIEFPHTYTESEVNCYLKKLPLEIGALATFREKIESRDKKTLVHYVQKAELSEEDFKYKVVEKILDGQVAVSPIKKFAIRLFSRKPMVYSSLRLTPNLQNKIDNLLTTRVTFLLQRINIIKSVLIDDDDDIQEVWVWGRSKEIKAHMKFLMRQRYMKEGDVRACIEMAFGDCLNILDKQILDFCEKSDDLFREVKLRNVVLHCYHLMECVSTILVDDLPSEIVNKCLDLITYSEVIEKILQSIGESASVDCDSFEKWVEINNPVINECPVWQKFLFLMPLA